MTRLVALVLAVAALVGADTGDTRADEPYTPAPADKVPDYFAQPMPCKISRDAPHSGPLRRQAARVEVAARAVDPAQHHLRALRLGRLPQAVAARLFPRAAVVQAQPEVQLQAARRRRSQERALHRRARAVAHRRRARQDARRHLRALRQGVDREAGVDAQERQDRQAVQQAEGRRAERLRRHRRRVPRLPLRQGQVVQARSRISRRARSAPTTRSSSASCRARWGSSRSTTSRAARARARSIARSRSRRCASCRCAICDYFVIRYMRGAGAPSSRRSCAITSAAWSGTSRAPTTATSS